MAATTGRMAAKMPEAGNGWHLLQSGNSGVYMFYNDDRSEPGSTDEIERSSLVVGLLGSDTQGVRFDPFKHKGAGKAPHKDADPHTHHNPTANPPGVPNDKPTPLYVRPGQEPVDAMLDRFRHANGFRQDLMLAGHRDAADNFTDEDGASIVRQIVAIRAAAQSAAPATHAAER